MTNMASSVVDALSQRWNLKEEQAEAIRCHGGSCILAALGVSLGLGDLFDDDISAERDWLARTRMELNGATALEAIVDWPRGADIVLRLVNFARGIG